VGGEGGGETDQLIGKSPPSPPNHLLYSKLLVLMVTVMVIVLDMSLALVIEHIMVSDTFKVMVLYLVMVSVRVTATSHVFFQRLDIYCTFIFVNL
jgi:hypothetical protein